VGVSSEGGEKEEGKVRERRQGSPPIIGVGVAPGRRQRFVMVSLMALKPLMAGGG
jgi:hypothetical protein